MLKKMYKQINAWKYKKKHIKLLICDKNNVKLFAIIDKKTNLHCRLRCFDVWDCIAKKNEKIKFKFFEINFKRVNWFDLIANDLTKRISQRLLWWCENNDLNKKFVFEKNAI